MPRQTPSQTVGPFFAYGLTPAAYGHEEIATGRIVEPTAVREPIVITGRMLDGAGQPVGDALLELWQPDERGRFPDPAAGGGAGFRGFGRAGTDAAGCFRFETVKPGPVAGPDARPQAPHISVIIFARGLLSHLYTRLYFADESANEADAVLQALEPARRGTLLARREAGGGVAHYVFDVHLQGERETVFFDA
jgi:protocatechuate 3,4-dioxygenase alpha subunit